MTVALNNSAFRKALFGLGPVTKSTGTLAATTVDLFIVAGGEVLLTAVYGKVTTAITVANSYYLKVTPTTGDAAPLCAAVDIGTTDTAAGSLLGFGSPATAGTTPYKLMSPTGNTSAGYGFSLPPIAIPTGKIQSVSAGTDGVISWYVLWVPLTDGATLVAA